MVYRVTRANPNGVKVAQPESVLRGSIGSLIQAWQWMRVGYRVTIGPALPPSIVDHVFDSLSRGLCPDCSGDEFFEGPHGGLSINYECASCRHRFNVSFGPNGMFRAERI